MGTKEKTYIHKGPFLLATFLSRGLEWLKLCSKEMILAVLKRMDWSERWLKIGRPLRCSLQYIKWGVKRSRMKVGVWVGRRVQKWEGEIARLGNWLGIWAEGEWRLKKHLRNKPEKPGYWLITSCWINWKKNFICFIFNINNNSNIKLFNRILAASW